MTGWCVVLLATGILHSSAAAQTSETDLLRRTFTGNADTCIFNTPDGASKNCITGTATFLSTPVSTAGEKSFPAQRLRTDTLTFAGPGMNLGGPLGWTTQQGEYREVTSYRRGITQNLTLLSRCRRIGDCANYFYIEHDGGIAAVGDEAVEALGLQANETAAPYAGKLLATSGTGDTRPKLDGGADQWVTDGGILLDVTRGTLAGELSGTSNRLGNYLVQLRLTTPTLPKSIAWGTLTAGYAKPTSLANESLPVTVEVVLGALDGRHPAFVPGLVCVAGPGQFEQAVIQPEDPAHPLPRPEPGHQSLRMLVRYPNAAYTSEGRQSLPMLFQGGVCGQYLSADADLAFSGMRTTYPAFGSLTGSDVITAKQVGGTMSPYLPQEGSQAWALSGAKSRFHLYPGAEIVANNRLSPELEPNRVPWSPGDRIESPHHMTVGQNVLFIVDQQASPTDSSYGGSGIELILRGKGIAGQHKGIFLVNAEAATSYKPFGGPLVPPNATYFQGEFNDLHQLYNAPNNALTDVTNCSTAGHFALFDLPNRVTNHVLKVDYDCATGRILIPRLQSTDIIVDGILERSGSQVCTEDGAHCPSGTPLQVTVEVPAVPAGTCASVTAEVPGLTDAMTISASARVNPGLVTTSTYFAGANRAGLVVCAPVAASRAAIFNLQAR